MIEVEKAIKNTRNQNVRWSFSNATRNSAPELAVNRIGSGTIELAHEAKFRCNTYDEIFTLGSCFAREIETFLVKEGFQVTSRLNELPEHPEFRLRKGVTNIFDFFNRYNLGSMYQEVESLIHDGSLTNTEDLFFEATSNQYDDLHYTPAVQSSDLQGAISRRRFIQSRLSKALQKSDVVVLTLGLCESWYDLESQKYLNVVSSPQMLMKYKNRLRFKFIGARENIDLLERTIELLGDKKIILTVSPVPLEVTFTGQDIIEANMAAKSTLRAVAHEVAQNFGNIDYFPSYEIALLSNYSQVWKEDGRHVQPGMVNKIVQSAKNTYFSESAPLK